MIRLTKFLAYSVVFICLMTFSLWAASALLEPVPLVPADGTDGSVVQVYGADVWGVRGYFAIHTWVATKTAGESRFTIHQVVGWKLRREGSAVMVSTGNPDRPWFGSPAVLLHEVTGAEAVRLIPEIRQAVRDYPYDKTYNMWPGPNSNSFTQWVALKVPELGLQLPVKAIGKSWMTDNIGVLP